jgi:hypothetical protein
MNPKWDLKWVLYLIAAIAVLLPPIPFSREVRDGLRRRSIPDLWAAARLWQNWVDLARAALGVYFLEMAFQGLMSFLGWNGPDSEMFALGAKSGVLGAALLVQTIRNFHKVQFLAPVFYLCGVTLILGSGALEPGSWTWGGLFAVGVGWLFAVGGQNLAYQLPAMAVAAAVAACVLGPRDRLAVSCALMLVPWVLSVLFKKRLHFASAMRPE